VRESVIVCVCVCVCVCFHNNPLYVPVPSHINPGLIYFRSTLILSQANKI